MAGDDEDNFQLPNSDPLKTDEIPWVERVPVIKCENEIEYFPPDDGNMMPSSNVFSQILPNYESPIAEIPWVECVPVIKCENEIDNFPSDNGNMMPNVVPTSNVFSH
jgi:hypothetical protein